MEQNRWQEGGYQDAIRAAADRLRAAEKVVVGIGSGMSAAGGLDYGAPEPVRRWYPEYYAMGLRSIVEIQQLFWTLERGNEPAGNYLLRYWGFWARHIWHIRYETAVTRPYMDLMKLLQGKDYFVCTTNCDGQVQKAGVPLGQIFAPQGDYGLFQCGKPCTEEVYGNERMIRQMVEHMPDAFHIRAEEVPVCPRCGRLLAPNLRCDETFVETPHVENLPDYEAFLQGCAQKRTVFLELGVGFNTPGIIRFPFELLAKRYEKAHLVRINNTCAALPPELAQKGTAVQADLGVALQDLCAAGENTVQ